MLDTDARCDCGLSVIFPSRADRYRALEVNLAFRPLSPASARILLHLASPNTPRLPINLATTRRISSKQTTLNTRDYRSDENWAYIQQP